jgi:hypothetical protein
MCHAWQIVTLKMAHEYLLLKTKQNLIFKCNRTYLCKQAFSSVKQIKDKQWSQFMDCNFKNLVILTKTKLQPNIHKLAGVRQRQ